MRLSPCRRFGTTSSCMNEARPVACPGKTMTRFFIQFPRCESPGHRFGIPNDGGRLAMMRCARPGALVIPVVVAVLPSAGPQPDGHAYLRVLTTLLSDAERTVAVFCG